MPFLPPNQQRQSTEGVTTYSQNTTYSLLTETEQTGQSLASDFTFRVALW